jgi:hypothetical protein
VGKVWRRSLKVLRAPKKSGWFFVDNAEVMEGISDDIGVWFGDGDDDTKHVVYVWVIVGGLDADFLGGDEVHDYSLGV